VIKNIQHQIEESRRLIERSRGLMRLGREEMFRSKLIIADARRIVDAIRSEPRPRPAPSDPASGDNFP
jgi:hypothetical protein